jgi:hypothetical protein
MLAVTLVTGVIAVGVSVAVMSSETTEKTRTKADIKYLEAKQPYNFGKDKASVDNFKKLRDDRLIDALRDPRVDLQFVRDLSEDQIKNMVKYAGTADVILSMPETQRLSLVDNLAGHLIGANAKVAATVLSISSRPTAKMTNDDGVRWAEVLRQLLELHERAQPDIRGNVQNQIEAILKTSPEPNTLLSGVAETFVEYGASFLKYIRHDALAHVLHAFDNSSVSKLYNCPAMKNFTTVDIDIVKSRLGPSRLVQSDPIYQLILKMTSQPRQQGAQSLHVDRAEWETGEFVKDVPTGDFKAVFNRTVGKAVVNYSPTTRELHVVIKDIQKYFLLCQFHGEEIKHFRGEANDLLAARDELDDARMAIPTGGRNETLSKTLLRDASLEYHKAIAGTTRLQVHLEKADPDSFGRVETVVVELTTY